VKKRRTLGNSCMTVGIPLIYIVRSHVRLDAYNSRATSADRSARRGCCGRPDLNAGRSFLSNTDTRNVTGITFLLVSRALPEHCDQEHVDLLLLSVPETPDFDTEEPCNRRRHV